MAQWNEVIIISGRAIRCVLNAMGTATDNKNASSLLACPTHLLDHPSKRILELIRSLLIRQYIKGNIGPLKVSNVSRKRNSRYTWQSL